MHLVRSVRGFWNILPTGRFSTSRVTGARARAGLKRRAVAREELPRRGGVRLSRGKEDYLLRSATWPTIEQVNAKCVCEQSVLLPQGS